jgi:hypothetical protein
MLHIKGGPARDNTGELHDLPTEDPTVQANHTEPHLNFVRLEQPNTKSKSTKCTLADKAAKLSTPLKHINGIRHSYLVLFKFRSMGYYRRTIESSLLNILSRSARKS